MSIRLLKINIRIFFSKFKQAYCKHEILQCGGGYENGKIYTGYTCMKCHIYLKEIGIDRSVSCEG